MKAAELLIRCLEMEGVKYIYGLPGEENMDILDALLDSPIKFISARHEQGAAFMADLQGRLTGRAGVCLSTLGPGATNLMTGVADANVDRAPVVAITGQCSRDLMHKESHQYINIVGTFRYITKWNMQIREPSVIPEIVRKAFKLAQQEKPGATHIDFPEDVAKLDIEANPLPPEEFLETPAPMEASVKRAAQIISRAKTPIVLAGNGVIRGHASHALMKFAERLNIPVANTFMGKGCLPYNHPLSLMSVGLQARDFVNCGFDVADLVIAVGYDMVEYQPALWNPLSDKLIIHVDATPSEVDASYIPAVEVVGDIRKSLEMLALEARREEGPGNYVFKLREMILEELNEFKGNRSFPMKPQRVISDLRAALGEQDILISDVGAHKLWIARMYPCYHPNTCIISNGYAAMGIALPGAIAAKLWFPERKVLAAAGDGGFMMNCQEIETAIRVGTPLVVLIFNDKGYGSIRWKQLTRFGRPAFVDFANPKFARLAESFGAKGYEVQSADELLPILKEALAKEAVSVIDCPVDYSENLGLTERLGRLVCPI